jgi:hypothetical protein
MANTKFNGKERERNREEEKKMKGQPTTNHQIKTLHMRPHVERAP